MSASPRMLAAAWSDASARVFAALAADHATMRAVDPVDLTTPWSQLTAWAATVADARWSDAVGLIAAAPDDVVTAVAAGRAHLVDRLPEAPPAGDPLALLGELRRAREASEDAHREGWQPGGTPPENTCKTGGGTATPLKGHATVPPTRTLSSIAESRVEWLVPGMVPIGAVTLLVGPGGLGKTTLSTWWAARASRGEPLVPGTDARPPVDVILVSCEDGAAEVVKPRARLAGADMDRLHVWDLEGQDLALPDHTEALLAEVDRLHARLVIVDPITAVISDRVNTHQTASLRRMLAPLAAGMHARDVALLAIAHPNKGQGGDITDRTSGSAAWVQAARSALAFGTPPGAEEGDPRRVVALAKSNYGQAGIAYDVELVVPDGEAHPVIRWVGASSVTSWDVLTPLGTEERTLAAEATEWLAAHLADGARPSKDVTRAGSAEGFSPKTLRTARQRLDVVVAREGFPATTTWALPDPAPVVPSGVGTTATPPRWARLEELDGQGVIAPAMGSSNASCALLGGQGTTGTTSDGGTA